MSKTLQYPFGPLPYSAEPKDFTGDNILGIYTAETTQRYVLGTRYVTWDGRVFKYARSGNTTLLTQWAAYNQNEEHVKWAALAANAGVGLREVAVTVDADDGCLVTTGADAAGVIAEDELAGGYICFYQTDADLVRLNCGILGNTATTGAGTLYVYLDSPLPIPMTKSSYVEVLASPYLNVSRYMDGANHDNRGSFVGVPMRGLTALQYGWLQTWGPICISPGASGLTGNGIGSSPGEREAVFGGNGCLYEHNVGDVADQYQHAGFILNSSTAAAGGPPFIMLQISI